MRMTWALGGAIAAAAVLAWAGARQRNAVSTEQEPARLAAARADGPTSSAPDAPSALQGEVLETLPVANYTYLRLATSAGEVWAAIPSATVELHRQVQIADATRMDDFNSSTLKRTFKVIYFGTLAGPSASRPARAAPAAELRAVSDDDPLPPGHPDIGSAESADSLPAGHPSLNEAAPFDAPPHSPSALTGAAPGSEPALPSPPSERARGKNGHLIAELVAARNSLAGQPVRVRGQVTKVTDVQDHAFFHIRDASLAADGQPADVVVTSLTRPKRGDIATFDGILRADVDVGIGYKYPALLENATISAE